MLKPQLKIEQNGVLTDVGAWFKPSMADEKPSLEDVCNLRHQAEELLNLAEEILAEPR